MSKIFYHGSQEWGIETLEPRFKSRRHDQKEPRLYVAPEMGIAAVFILDADDTVRRFGRYVGEPWTIEVTDREKFHDASGWIYTVDGEGAIPIGNGSLDVYFLQPKKVIDRLFVPSALEFVQQHGIKLKYR